MPVASAQAALNCPSQESVVRHDLSDSYCELCGTGTIEIQVSNPTRTGSGDPLRDITVTETLFPELELAGSVTAALNGGFPQTVTTQGSGQSFSWDSSDIPSLAELNEGDILRIFVPVRSVSGTEENLTSLISRSIEVSTSYTCVDTAVTPDPPQPGFDEDTDQLPLREPLPSLEKDGQNRDAGQTNWTDPVYGNINDDVVWRVRIGNSGLADMQDVRLDELMDDPNMDILWACSSAAAAQASADNDGAATGGCISADNTVNNFALTGGFASGPGIVDVEAGGTTTIFFVGKVNTSCSNGVNTVTDLQWGCEITGNGAGGVSQTSTGSGPFSATAQMSALSQGNLTIQRAITGTNTGQPLGSAGFVTLTISNRTGGSVKNIELRDVLPPEYVVDTTYDPRVLNPSPAYGDYAGFADQVEWDAFDSNPLNNTEITLRLISGETHPIYGDQVNMLRHGDRVRVRFRIVTVEPDFYDKIADLDDPQESAGAGSDPNSNTLLSGQNQLFVQYEDFCSAGPGSPRTQQHFDNVTPDPEDLDVSMSHPLYIVRDSGTSPLTVQITNNGGHDANDYFVYVSFGEAMNVVTPAAGCTATGNPPGHPVWNSPSYIPTSATVYRCTSAALGTISPNGTETQSLVFQVERNHGATDDDLTFRADVIGEITLSDGTPLTFPQPADLNGAAGTTPTPQLANNYTLDGVRAKVLGFNLLKQQSGQCSELNEAGFPNDNIIIGEDCKFEIFAGGWFGFDTPGFNLIEVNNVSIVDDLPDGQGYIDDTRLTCAIATLPNPDSDASCRDITGTVNELGGLNTAFSETDFEWNIVDSISDRDRWLLTDMTTRLLNDPVDTINTAPNQHASASTDYGRGHFFAVFDTETIEVDETQGIPGYPPESDWRVDLTVTEPFIEVEKQVCNENLYGSGVSCSNFVDDTNEGHRDQTYIFRLTLTNRTADNGVDRAPAYDLVITDTLDPSGQMCVQPLQSDGLDNDGDGSPETGSGDDGWVGITAGANDYSEATHCSDGGIPAIVTFSYEHSTALERIDPGQSVTLYYRVKPHQSVAPLQTFTNTFFARYDSLEGDSGAPKNRSIDSDADNDGVGDGTPAAGRARHYQSADATAQMQIIEVQAEPKQALALSNGTASGSGSDNVVVGEEIRYRLTAQIPAAKLRNFVIRDELPAGMRCIEGQGVNLDAAPYNAAGFAPGGTFTPTCTSTGSNDYIEWNFGDQELTTVAGSLFEFPVEFIARIENSANTDDGDVIGNGGSYTTAQVSYIDELGNTVVVPFESHEVTVREPAIQLTKSMSAPTSDADDILTVTVTAENIGTANAYNLQVLDDLSGKKLTFLQASGVAGTDPPNTIDTTTVGANAPIFSWNRSNADYTIAPGETKSFTFQVRVDEDVEPQEILDNTIQARWQSLPGRDVALNSGNNIGVDGADDGMRIGVLPNAGDPINNYETSASAQSTVLPLQFQKSDLDASVIPTIGAHKQFQLEILLPEGISENVVVSDNLAAGGASYALTHSSAYDITYEFIGIDSINDSAQPPAESDFISFPGEGTGATGVISWNIGKVDTASDTAGNPLNPRIRIKYFARVNNVAAVQEGVSLNNGASLTYDHGEDDSEQDLAAPPVAAVTVVEPQLEIEKVVTNISVPGQPALGGHILEYTVTVRHSAASTADAFDLNLRDELPPELQFNSAFVPIAQIGGIDVSGFEPTPAGTPLGPLVWGKNNGDNSLDLPRGSELVLVYRAEVRGVFGSPISNRVRVDWTSLDDIDTGFERHGDGCPVIAAPNDYCSDFAEAVIVTDDNTAIEKSVYADSDADTPVGTLRLGDTVTYTLNLTLQAGTTPGLSVVDTLPPGMVFDSIVSINGDTSAPYQQGNGFNYADIPASAVPAQGQENAVNWTLGDIEREFSNSAPLIIRYTARVAEDNGIAQLPTAQQLTNTAILNYGSESVQDDALIELRQPLIDSLQKTERSGKTNPYTVLDLLNDTMQFRLHACNSGDAPAYNLRLTDDLAPQFDETSISAPLVSIGGVPLVQGSDYVYSAPAAPGEDMVFTFAAPLAAGQCLDIDYDVGFRSDVGSAESWANSFTVDEYWSLPDSSGQRYAPVSLPLPFQMQTTAASADPLLKELLAPADGTAAVGEEIRYRITVPSSPVTSSSLAGVVVTDTLDGLGDSVLFESATLDGVAVTPVIGANTLTFDVGVVTAGTSAVIEIVARVADAPSATDGTVISNRADYTYLEGGSPVAGGGNAVDFTIVEPQLVMDKEGPAGGTLQSGMPGSFTLDIHNTGNGEAWDITISDLLPNTAQGGMCETQPQITSAQIVDGGGAVLQALNAGADFAVTFDPASCVFSVTTSGANAVIPPDHHLVIGYDAWLDTDTENGTGLSNIAGATLWHSLAMDSSDQVRAYARALSDGTPSLPDHEDIFTITAQVPSFEFRKTVVNVTTGQDPGSDASPGDRLRYSILVRNLSDLDVSDIEIADELDALNAAPLFVPGSLALITAPAGSDSSATDASGGAKGSGNLQVANLSLEASGGAADYFVIEFEATLAAVIDSGTVVLNQARLLPPGMPEFVSDDPNVNGADDPQVVGDEDPTQSLINSAPQLVVEKTSADITGDADLLMVGDTLRYTLRVENTGNENMVDAVLRDQVPANTTYVAGSTTLNGNAIGDVNGGAPLAAGMAINSPGEAEGFVGVAAAGAAAVVVTFDVTINDVNDGTIISNQGFVNGNGAGSGALDEVPSDDPATDAPNDPTVDIVGDVPLLIAHKTVEIVIDNMSAGIVDPGDVLRYTIAVANMGGVDATRVALTDQVPANTTYVANSTTLNGFAVADNGGGTSRLDAGLPISSDDLTPPMPGADEGVVTSARTATVTFDVTVNAGTPTGTVISNQGSVYSVELPLTLTDADGNPSNGAQPTEVVVGDVQQLSITKEVAVVGGGAAEAGAVLEYLVKVTNISAVPATYVTITDDLLVAGEGVLTYVADFALLNGLAGGISVDGSVIAADFAAVYGELQPGDTATLRFQAKLSENLEIGYRVLNTAEVQWNDPPASNQASVAIDVGGTPGIANLNGYLWHDVNFNEQLDSDERLLLNWTVELYFNNALLETVQSDDNGYFQFDGLVPNYFSSTTAGGASYELKYIAPDAGANTASLGITSSDFTNGPQTISEIYVGSGANPQNLNLPITPNGVIYDSVLRQPISGATVTMLRASTEQVLPDRCFDDPKQQSQVTQAGGYYKFDINFADAACPANQDYLIRVQIPGDNYVAGESAIIPPQTDEDTAGFDVAACLGSTADRLPGTPDHCEAQLSELPPPLDVDARDELTDYYLRLTLDDNRIPGESQLFNNHIAVDPQLDGALSITKTAALLNVTRSQLVPYTITFGNTLPVPLTDLRLVDFFPAGFKYVAGSARLDGEAIEPQVDGLQLGWPDLRVEADQTREVKLLLVVGSGVGEGKYVNRARMFNQLSGQVASGEASATVRVIPDPTFDCTDVIGKVYDDKNMNGYQDAGEGGVPGARVVTATGLNATTDAHGRFHITCAVVPNQDRGSNFVLKLDDRSLPSGYRLTTENPRVLRATRGKMLKFNFGTSLHRVVRLDMAEAVFEPGTTELRPQWHSRTELLLEKLQEAPSVLRLSYLAENEEADLVEERLESIKAQIADEWARNYGDYELTIETEVFWRRGAPPNNGRLE
ncbi:DUF11 domain-containing protein [Microbulbifer donghaiensis]|uniref:DUF11 domain-containing protein n=1 Tax=Microbulbifer donghaiensis TaxID=494016 RepID=UPI001356327E|nr:DUF11 domain-containing protein [Microbulbifer donghaiensis]